MLSGNHILCYHYLVILSVRCKVSSILKRVGDLLCIGSCLLLSGVRRLSLPASRPGLGPRSSYIFMGIYGYMTVRITVGAYCSEAEQKPICPTSRSVTDPENTVHTAPRPLGQLESTSNSWCVMIGWNNL